VHLPRHVTGRRDSSDQEFVGLERRIKDLVREEVITPGVV
jgi:hypothetical protein